MTPTQLKTLEAELQKRGYKKWTHSLVGRENHAWIKSFGIHKDKYGDTTNDYQIFFRIFDWRKRPNFSPEAFPSGSEIWITVTMIPTELDNRLDCDYSMQLDVPGIDVCEAMMAEVFEVAKKWIKQK